MKIIAVNGSPRKNWNTATLLNQALEGAAAQGAETELIHLYDLSYKGCISCFACKQKGGKSYGKCILKDDLTPVFQSIEQADAVLLGSPIYLGRVTGEMASFLDRFFQYLVYSEPPETLFPRKIPAGAIYTMNLNEDGMKAMSIDRHVAINEFFLEHIFGSAETLVSFDTYQFDDYSRVVAPRFDADAKARRRREVFPVDCKKAFDLGARLVTP